MHGQKKSSVMDSLKNVLSKFITPPAARMVAIIKRSVSTSEKLISELLIIVFLV